MWLITRLRLLFEAWKNTWSPLEYDETAMGIEPLPLQGTYQLWVSIRGTKLFWLSGHRTLASAEGALVQVAAWARRVEQMDPVAHAVEMALLRDIGDFRAHPPSERMVEAIRQRIKVRDPSVLIVAPAPPFSDEGEGSPPRGETWDGTVPDARTMQLIRATNEVKVWLQLQALRQTPKTPQAAPPEADGGVTQPSNAAGS